MKKIHVKVKSGKYPIYVGSNLLQKIQILYKQKLLGVKNVILISTNKVPKKYKMMVKKSFVKKNFISLDIKSIDTCLFCLVINRRKEFPNLGFII